MLSLLDSIVNTIAFKVFKVKSDIALAVSDFKEDERGLSGVVVAILLILVAVLAVALIWGFLGDYIQELFDRIINADTIE